MLRYFRMLRERLQLTWGNKDMRVTLLFGLEGLMLQYVTSINGFGNNLYATNMGASDSQIGMVQLVLNLVAVVLLLPIGIVANRQRSSKTLPVAMLLFMGAMYFVYATVPEFGSNRIAFFFVFLGLTAGVLAVYNAQWQAFFGDAVAERKRNGVYSFRNRFMFLVGTVAPVVCGLCMGTAVDSEGKLLVLRVFYYIAGALVLCQALILSRIPCPKRTDAEMAAVKRFSPREIGQALGQMATTRAFRSFFLCIMFFYLAWHLDWSMWYIGQTQYIHMTEAQLSYYNGLVCVGQLLTVGLFARLNERKTVHFSFIFAVLGHTFCSLAMLVGVNLPQGSQLIPFMAMGILGSVPQGCIQLCAVQMLLDVTPQRNRALIISLHTMVVTLSNAVMPYLGVQLYQALGADHHAMTLFALIALCARGSAALLFIWRYRHLKKTGRLHPTMP